GGSRQECRCRPVPGRRRSSAVHLKPYGTGRGVEDTVPDVVDHPPDVPNGDRRGGTVRGIPVHHHLNVLPSPDLRADPLRDIIDSFGELRRLEDLCDTGRVAGKRTRHRVSLQPSTRRRATSRPASQPVNGLRHAPGSPSTSNTPFQGAGNSIRSVRRMSVPNGAYRVTPSITPIRP